MACSEIRFVLPPLEVKGPPPPRGHKLVCCRCPNGRGDPPPNPAVLQIVAQGLEPVPLCVECAPGALELVVAGAVHEHVQFFVDDESGK
jgi:hypothetical protein